MQGDGLLGKETKANEIFLSSPSSCNDAPSSIIILLGQCEERSAAQDDSRYFGLGLFSGCNEVWSCPVTSLGHL